MIKKTLPIVLGCVVGLYAFIEFFIPHYHVRETTKELLDYAAILGAAAFVLGAINVFQVTAPKIRRKEADWPYKLVMLVAAGVMLLAGLGWDAFRSTPPAPQVTVAADPAVPEGKALIFIDAPSYVGARIPGYPPEPGAEGKISYLNGPANQGLSAIDGTFVVEPGTHSLELFRREAGYSTPSAEITVAAGQMATVRGGTPTMLWGKDGRVKTWLFDFVFYPCNSTMFALLAFFVVSAAFRAFRARNLEAGLLLGSAIIILLGRAPLGRLIGEWMVNTSPYLPEPPDIANWIIDIPNNAGRRAIMMGAAIGGIATGLRIILGLERSHLGAD